MGHHSSLRSSREELLAETANGCLSVACHASAGGWKAVRAPPHGYVYVATCGRALVSRGTQDGREVLMAALVSRATAPVSVE